MKKTLLFLFLIVFSAAFSQITKKVFFIGNSYTYFNDLPILVQDIAQSTGDILEHQSQTPGGSTLQQHINSTTIATLMQGNWDYVVLQEQSQLPSLTDQQVQTQVYPYAAQLSDFVKNTNGCGNVIFYMTWGRKNGDASRCSVQPSVCTYEGMDDLISKHYIEMAMDNEAILSPVGKVWRAIRELDPALELYNLDESHPSYIGSMVAAYTFYTVIFKKDPTLAPYNGTLIPGQAQFIKNMVKTIVYDSMDTWNIPSNDVHSRFTYQATSTHTIKFTNKTKNATTYGWDFGDGTTSTLENPEHTYNAPGNYLVKLTSNSCNSNTTKTKHVTVGNLGTKDLDIEDPAQIYPNPTQNDINIITKKKTEILSLTDASGRVISYQMNKTNSGYTIQLHHLSVGVYFLKYKIGEKEFIKKIIKK
ncbi:PKD domain-containing protein [Chryseobacterium jejuense]|uniref:FOG: PKD repeat n=1 Tax=Chryseobacterium jejuense TaxID=445960 RepID=A0A2X2WQR3_CHRJE|nr:PKD domain-containing protein [Chryseobacterium jejuense]SDJ66785.1 Por secretion system C-terminal sorting domain-containing protein [Chryseobacterium jejuense]SQB43138.1 FOG: PKD repeat [Chryseobacterium jejuense]